MFFFNCLIKMCDIKFNRIANIHFNNCAFGVCYGCRREKSKSLRIFMKINLLRTCWCSVAMDGNPCRIIIYWQVNLRLQIMLLLAHRRRDYVKLFISSIPLYSHLHTNILYSITQFFHSSSDGTKRWAA